MAGLLCFSSSTCFLSLGLEKLHGEQQVGGEYLHSREHGQSQEYKLIRYTCYQHTRMPEDKISGGGVGVGVAVSAA